MKRRRRYALCLMVQFQSIAFTRRSRGTVLLHASQPAYWKGHHVTGFCNVRRSEQKRSEGDAKISISTELKNGSTPKEHALRLQFYACISSGFILYFKNHSSTINSFLPHNLRNNCDYVDLKISLILKWFRISGVHRWFFSSMRDRRKSSWRKGQDSYGGVYIIKNEADGNVSKIICYKPRYPCKF